MRKLVAAAVVGLAFAGQASGAGAGSGMPSHGSPEAVVAKTCSPGFTHAMIGGEQKCLHAGEYCSHAEARQYRRYHFVCVRVRGTYRLERS
jgi:hypothetical protein